MNSFDLQDVVDALAENAAIVDEQGYILLINRAWVDFSVQNNAKNERINTGANYFDIVQQAADEGDHYARSVIQGFRDLLDNKTTEFELEYPCHSQDEERWFLANIKEVGNTKPRRFLCTHKDISKLVEREKKVRIAERIEAIGQLAGGIAHDFNNILSVLQGNLQLIRRKIDSDTTIDENLEISLSAIHRGVSLVRKLLLLAKEQKASKENIDTNEFVRETIKIIGRTLGEDIHIVLECSDEKLPIQVDSSLLGSAILNIALNSRHAMPTGGTLTIKTSRILLEKRRFTTSTEDVSGSYIQISIKDTGTGIAEQYLHRVLEPFFTTKNMDKGSGLGLSMVNNFVKQSDGYIDIESITGEGTTVSLYFPESDNLILQNTLKSSVDPGKATGKKVLLVEDDQQVREVFDQMLNTLGCKVIQSQDASRALEILEDTTDIDFVLSDIVMPGKLSGLDLAEQMLEKHPDKKVLLMSGYTDKTFAHDPEKDIANSLPILQKPVSIEELAKAIEDLFN